MQTSDAAERVLRERFGLEAFKPGQREVMEALLTLGAALAVFPTGAGKSLCYQLPALMLDGLTLVVSPLIALMKDQLAYLRELGIPAGRMDSSMRTEEMRQTGEELRSGRLRLLYVAPERFNNERFLAELNSQRIALFAVDEAHCISEWGHNFRPEYLKLAQVAHEINAERVLALTATATPKVVADICAGFGVPREGAVITGFYRSNLQLHTTPVTAGERPKVLLERLRARPTGPTIVYVTHQKTAEDVAEELSRAGFAARAYHAGMEPDARTAVQDWWTDSANAIVVATIAFGMGIDKANVRYVYHYNLPKSLESYSQEIGRAGRDGLASTVELLACLDDVPTLENFAFGDTPTRSAIHAIVHELLGLGPEFDVSVADLAARSDIRVIVVRTLLTYLELLGVLRQGTPFYVVYEGRPLEDVAAIGRHFEGGARRMLETLFASAKKGRIWYRWEPARAAMDTGLPRERILRALQVLEERGLLELRTSDVRLRFSRCASPTPDEDALVAELARRFERHEEQESDRLQQVLALVTRAECQSNALAAYFGETRTRPCGHCSFCRDGASVHLPPATGRPPIAALVDRSELDALRRAHPASLESPRQRARFLCGLSSPALSRVRLSAHPLFGVLEGQRFAEVLAYLEAGDSAQDGAAACFQVV